MSVGIREPLIQLAKLVPFEFVRRRLYLKSLPFIFLPFKNQCCPTHLIGKVFCWGPVNLINPFIF